MAHSVQMTKVESNKCDISVVIATWYVEFALSMRCITNTAIYFLRKTKERCEARRSGLIFHTAEEKTVNVFFLFYEYICMHSKPHNSMRKERKRNTKKEDLTEKNNHQNESIEEVTPNSLCTRSTNFLRNGKKF